MSGTGVFDVPEATVVGAVSCTWCAVGVGQRCRDYKWFMFQPCERPHMQRWRDYWNATHDEQTEVYPAPWLAKALGRMMTGL